MPADRNSPAPAPPERVIVLFVALGACFAARAEYCRLLAQASDG